MQASFWKQNRIRTRKIGTLMPLLEREKEEKKEERSSLRANKGKKEMYLFVPNSQKQIREIVINPLNKNK